jgi:DNA topoisomerase-2
VYEQSNDRWEYTVANAPNGNGNDNVSFVNGLATIRGGKHVDHVMNQIVKKLSEKIINRNKTITSVKSSTIKNNLILFLKCTIVNPTFDSQSKETLTTPVSKFGSKVEVSDKFIEKLYKTGITEKVLCFN